jgi:hypothetical protein
VAFQDASKRTKYERFQSLDIRLGEGITANSSLVNLLVDDPDLLESWHEARLLPESQALMQIGSNIVEAEKSLPKTSPAHTSILQASTIGMFMLVINWSISNSLRSERNRGSDCVR